MSITVGRKLIFNLDIFAIGISNAISQKECQSRKARQDESCERINAKTATTREYCFFKCFNICIDKIISS